MRRIVGLRYGEVYPHGCCCPSKRLGAALPVECRASTFRKTFSVRNTVVIAMEDPRCKIVTMKTEDPRCESLLTGVTLEMEDPRCKSLINRAVIEMDELRCWNVAVDIEDPRCNNLFKTW